MVEWPVPDKGRRHFGRSSWGLASRALGDIGAGAASVALAVAELIKDRDEWVRSAAIMALNRIGPTADCLPFLAGALQHQNDDNRRAAVRALAGSKENAAYAAAVRSNQDAQHGLPRTDSDTP